MDQYELQPSNYNYGVPVFLSRVKNLLLRDESLLGPVVQRSTVVVGPSGDLQHAITRFDVLPKTSEAGSSKFLNYGTLKYSRAILGKVDLLARLSKLTESKFEALGSCFDATGMGVIDRLEPGSNLYSEWPSRIFDVSFNSIQLSYEPLLHATLKTYPSRIDAIRDFLDLPGSGLPDGRLGHILVCIPNLNARISRLELDNKLLNVVAEGPTPVACLRVDISTKNDSAATTMTAPVLEKHNTQQATFELPFAPNALSAWLISSQGFLADFHDENQYYSNGANSVLPKYSPSHIPQLDFVETGNLPIIGSQQSANEQQSNELDDLLPLFRRKVFDKNLLTAIDVASSCAPLSLLVIDVDHFKAINDTHGHPGGDEVLIECAKVVKRRCGTKGAAYRCGGDEIVALIPNFTTEEATALAESIRKQVEALSIGPEQVKITVTIGVASCPDHATSGKELIKAADEALYAAKKEGRNLVRIATTIE